MKAVRVRSHLLGYKRDTYLRNNEEIQGNDVIDCAVGYSQWGVSPRAVIAHQEFDPSAVSAYQEMFYDKLLKPAILARFPFSGLKPQNIFFGHGSFNLAERLIHKMIMPDKMLGVGPQFNEIPTEFVAAGGKYEPVPIDRHIPAFPFVKIMAEISSGDYSLFYLDNPNNPLGNFVPIKQVKLIVEDAEKMGTIVLIDEAYADFLPDEMSAASLVPRFSNLAVIRSFSKGLGLAALRVGYMFLSDKLGSIYQELDVPFEPGLHAAAMAKATIEDKDFIAQTRKRTFDSKTKLVMAFQKAGFSVLATHSDVSIFVIHKPGKNVVRQMAEIKVKVEPGSAYCLTNPEWDNSFCRIRVVSGEAESILISRIETLL